MLGTADDHPIIKGPDRASGTADDLNDSNIDMTTNCSIAHGNLEQGITLPKKAAVLMTSNFEGTERAILAEYRRGQGLIIVDTLTKEFVDQNPSGVGASLFMRSLFAYALQRTKKRGV